MFAFLTTGVQFLRAFLLAGGGGVHILPSGLIGSSSTTVSNASNVDELDAWILTIPANTFSPNGSILRIVGRFRAAANANAKRFRIYMGNTVVWDSTAGAYNNIPLVVFGDIIRESVTAQRAAFSGGATSSTIVSGANPAFNLAVSTTIRFTVQSPTATAGDAIFEYGSVMIIPLAT